MIDNILNILKALNSNQKPWQVSVAVVLGMFIGFLPFLNIFSIIFFFLAFLLNINLGIFFLSATLFEVLGFFLDPVFNMVGKYILTLDFLVPIWTNIYNLPFARITNFNNTVVMGALIISLILALPINFAVKVLVVKYRKEISSLAEKYKLLKILRIFSIYEKVEKVEN